MTIAETLQDIHAIEKLRNELLTALHVLKNNLDGSYPNAIKDVLNQLDTTHEGLTLLRIKLNSLVAKYEKQFFNLSKIEMDNLMRDFNIHTQYDVILSKDNCSVLSVDTIVTGASSKVAYIDEFLNKL